MELGKESWHHLEKDLSALVGTFPDVLCWLQPEKSILLWLVRKSWGCNQLLWELVNKFHASYCYEVRLYILRSYVVQRNIFINPCH